MAEHFSHTPVSDDSSTGGPLDAQSTHRGVHYDPTDISLHGVIVVLAGIAVVFAGLGAAIWWTVQSQAPAHPPPGAATSYTTPSEPLPAQPRLEELNVFSGGAGANVFERQLAQEEKLHSYGPTLDDGYLHIPIDQAMKREATNLPVRPHPPTDAKSLGLVGAGEPNSGRFLRETPPWQE
jgi:hypothetical protein